LAVPAFFVAAMTLWLSYDEQNVLSKVDHAEQLRFARSTSISFAVLSLAFAGKYIAMPDSGNPHLTYFYSTFSCCSLQIIIFVAFCWALNKEGALPGANRNYVQITLLTSAFLVDTVANLALASDEKVPEAAKHHLWTACGLAALWGLCVVFWCLKLRSVIKVVRLVQPEGPSVARVPELDPH